MLEVGLIIWFIGIFGVLIKRRNLMELLLCIEVMLSGLILSFVGISLEMDDMGGILVSLMVLVIAAIESCIGLMVLVSYYNISKSMAIANLRVIKG